MRAIRRTLQVVALVGTILVGVIAVALIVSQTPWFRDWLRRYIVRESKQYVNGELSIGGLSGNLLFGVGLSDLAVDVSGQRVVAIKGLQVDYSVFEIVSKGIVLDDIKVTAPTLRVVHDANGWNLGHLIKAQEQESERKGPGRPISLPSIELTDGTIYLDDKTGSQTLRLPSRIDGLHVKGSFEYEPVHYSINLDDVRFHASSPDFTLQQLAGGLAVRDDNLYLQKLNLRTGESAMTIDGVIRDYLNTPTFEVATAGHVSVPEIARIVPAAEGYALNPSFDVKANGPASNLALDLQVESEAGKIQGQVTADVKAPDMGVKGELDLAGFNLAPVLKDPAQRSDLTGHAKVDVTLASAPESAPAMDRLRGTFAFNGPRVVAAGYAASNVRVTGAIQGPRITLDGRAAAYGGTATAKGFIVTPAKGRTLQFDLSGSATGVDLRKLPASTGVPEIATNLNASEYHVTGRTGQIEGNATLDSSEVEGATVAAGTVAQFATSRGNVSYSARGAVSDLDLQRIGHAFHIAALDKPDYQTRLNSKFDITGSGTKIEAMTLDATGTLTDSDAWGAHLPQLAYEAHLDKGALALKADGRFEHLDPGRVSGNTAVAGSVTGTANVSAQIANISAPITPESVTATGKVTLGPSKVAELQIDSAVVDGRYASRVGDLTELTLTGPDVTLDASGRLALDTTSSSDLKYHVDAIDLGALASLAGQEGVSGSAVLDGRLTGNETSLQTTGTMNGSGLAFQGNNALDANAQYTVTIPGLRFADAQVKATTSATFLEVGGQQINELKATTTYASKRLEFEASLQQQDRALQASGDVIFHPDHQEIHLPSLALQTQGIEWRMAPGGAAAIQYGSNRIQLQDVRLVSGNQSIEASGTVALGDEAAPGELAVQAQNVDVAQLDRLSLQNRGLGGQLDATVKLTGTAKAPVVDGHVQITGGSFQSYKYDSLTADVGYKPAGITLDATLQQSPTEAITAKGTIPMTLFQPSGAGHVPPSPGDEVNLHITSTALNLGVIQGFTTAVTNVTGVLRADVRLTGSGKDPHVEGIVDITGGGFGVPATGVSYTGLDTTIALSPERITIPNLRIVDEEGKAMTITGSLATHARQVGAVDVKITSNDFELIDNELGDVGVETNLQITGQLRRPKIAGDVKLQSARLEVDKILALFYDPYSMTALPAVPSAERSVEQSGSAEAATNKALASAETSAAAPGAEKNAETEIPPPSGVFGPLELDVHLRIPENLVLRGTSLRPGGPTGTALGDINITVGGNVDITKPPDGQLTLLGSVDTVRGTYTFQGRRFDLQRGGTVRFIGEPELNPLLDVTATREIPNTGVTAKVHITGTVKAPELQLSSEPPLEESDILALIIFNRPINELGTGERASLAATAGGIATGFLAQPLGESIGRALDLDLFEITTTTEGGDLGAGLTVGQQIGDRVFFKLRQTFGERTTSEFMVEYQLTDFLRLQATGAPETTGSANRIGQHRIEKAGIDMIFFFSY
jgi:autotransporter translocation and assembly factor TamB